MAWDLFCHVIDNYGDVGVCWRVAAELARRGQPVRLWIDDPAPLAWLAPGGAPGVEVVAWTNPAPDLTPGPVVIEAFGCAPPDAFVAHMARMAHMAHQPAQDQATPLWINLEYLSAEPYVARSHGLRSPQFSGPGSGLDIWFFYPGFTPSTGGLVAGLIDGVATTQASAQAWAAAQGWGTTPGEIAITVFCYANPALPALLRALAGPATLLRVPPGPVLAQLQGLQQAAALPAGMRLQALPYLAQTDFDRLLAAADLNLVRGEDSFVRAQRVSSAPFLWQAYPQADGAHAAKIAAFLGLSLADAPAAVAGPLRTAFLAFNGLSGALQAAHAPQTLALPDPAAWRAQHAHWRQQLAAQTDLCSQLLAFVSSHRSNHPSGSGQSPANGG